MPNSSYPQAKKFDHAEIHGALAQRAISEFYRTAEFVERQALFCPYYVTLEGVLGADWGVIVNPESARFGLLTFEHDFCGCPPHPEGRQITDEWLDKKLTEKNLKAAVAAFTRQHNGGSK